MENTEKCKLLGRRDRRTIDGCIFRQKGDAHSGPAVVFRQPKARPTLPGEAETPAVSLRRQLSARS